MGIITAGTKGGQSGEASLRRRHLRGNLKAGREQGGTGTGGAFPAGVRSENGAVGKGLGVEPGGGGGHGAWPWSPGEKWGLHPSLWGSHRCVL